MMSLPTGSHPTIRDWTARVEWDLSLRSRHLDRHVLSPVEVLSDPTGSLSPSKGAERSEARTHRLTPIA